MSCKTFKYIFLMYAVTTIFTLGFSFEWPQDPKNIQLFFGENRGQVFNQGVLFSQPAEVKTADEGKILIKLTENNDFPEQFVSPLGNTIILGHDNQILTIYGNLTNIKAQLDSQKVESNEIIGTTTNTDAQNNFLEFQVADTKMKTLINPVVLINQKPMPQNYRITNVELIDKKNVSHTVYRQPNIPSGEYILTMKREKSIMPQKIETRINGIKTEHISFDALKQQEHKLYFQGSTLLDFASIYPNDEKTYLSSIFLTRGKTTIEIILKNINDTESFFRTTVFVQ